MKQKVLLFDLETKPNLAYVWDTYEQNVISIEKERKLLCFAYKWLGKRSIVSHSLRYESEKAMLRHLHDLFNEADIIVGHNGDRFDIRMANAFFVHNGLTPPHPYKTVDTLKIARAKFRFNSNRLGDIAEYLHIGRKVETGGFKLWLGCINNDPASWRKMILYNKRDVALLEKVYLRIRPWSTNHPVVYYCDSTCCPMCGSKKIISRGWAYSTAYKRRRFTCGICHKSSSGKPIKI